VALQHAWEKAVVGSAHQHFHYDHKSGHITGFDGRVLDVEGGSAAKGTRVCYFDKKPDHQKNQGWDYVDGCFVSRMGTGFVMDIHGGTIANGTHLIVWENQNKPNQKWDIDYHGYIRSRANNSFCVDVNGGPNPGKGLTPLSLWTAAATFDQSEWVRKLQGAQNQRWHYDHKSGHITGYDGRVLDVNGGSTEKGTKVIFFDKKPDHSPNQQFDYKDGCFVTRMGTNFVVDINGGNMANGTELILWENQGKPNQKWDIDQFGVIRSRLNNTFVIDVSGGAIPGKGVGKIHIWTNKF